MIKTISFPSSNSGTGLIERARIFVPDDANIEFVDWLLSLNSNTVRHLLGSQYLDLKNAAAQQRRSLSNYLLLRLDQIFSESANPVHSKDYSSMQPSLFSSQLMTQGANGTFKPNHKINIQRWYPYIEGFSFDFVNSIIDEFASKKSKLYDPFAGTGTTVSVASLMGLQSYYSEINPFMRFVVEAKTNALNAIRHTNLAFHNYFEQVIFIAKNNRYSLEKAKELQTEAFGKAEYFVGDRLIDILSLKEAINTTQAPTPYHKHLAKLALGAIAVQCSEMKRAADLRKRTQKEALPVSFSVFNTYEHKVRQIVNDANSINKELGSVVCLSNSCLDQIRMNNFIDAIITSPPYANGTNYFRNTKLELWVTGLMRNQSELSTYRARAMAAGINNITKLGRKPTAIPMVEDVARELDSVAYDKRIPELVRRYFSDSLVWLTNCFNLLQPGGHAIIDIGDSRFAGVHIPTDELLIGIAKNVGYDHVETRFVRNRKSKDGSGLKQVLLVLRTPAKIDYHKSTRHDNYREKAEQFSRDLPHLRKPFSSRNWGHKLHSLCSYQGKLKPSLAHFLIDYFTKPGEVVLDPLSGSGTIPLEAFLQNRIAHGSDIQELAFILTQAKVGWGKDADVLMVANHLLDYVSKNRDKVSCERHSNFGFNGKLVDYYHAETFKEIVAARQYCLQYPCDSWEKAIVYSCLLHLLHGNRPYALSRRSHPVTPFKPQGPFEYREIAPRLLAKINRMINCKPPDNNVNGIACQRSYKDLNYDGNVDVVLTSPPFARSTRFFMSNWLRLWFSGWEPEHFNAIQNEFLETQQKKNMDVYYDFFKCANKWLKHDGKLIMHVGKTSKCDMSTELIKRCSEYFELIYHFDENVAGREKFGIRDQGATKSHQYLFFRKI